MPKMPYVRRILHRSCTFLENHFDSILAAPEAERAGDFWKSSWLAG